LRESEIPDLDFTVFLIRRDRRRKEKRRREWRRGEGNGRRDRRREWKRTRGGKRRVMDQICRINR
jgi:hypothetical protein